MAKITISMQMRPPHRVRYRAPAQAAPAAIPTPSAPTAPPHSKTKAKKLGFFFGRKWLFLVIVALIAGLTYLTYQYIHTKNELDKARNPVASGQTEADRLTNQIRKTLQLPNETPTLATISDVSKLKGQQFFKNAQNGDKVLIFSKSGRALLYRPSTKMIIEYAPVDLNNTKQ